MAETVSDLPVTFDILDGIIVDEGITLLDTLTADEQEEVENIVTLLDSAKENSLEQFELDENTILTTRHKNVSEDELDCLASKNNMQATTYQTRWAVAVTKDKFYPLYIVIFHET